MSDTPRCNALESNPLDSFDYHAWATLARSLEREVQASTRVMASIMASEIDAKVMVEVLAEEVRKLRHEGRDAIIEECAKIADECRVLCDEFDTPIAVAQEAGRDIARQIRALRSHISSLHTKEGT